MGEQQNFPGLSPPQQSEHALVGIVAVHPGKPAGLAVQDMEGGAFRSVTQRRMAANSSLRLAYFCQKSPAILVSRDPLSQTLPTPWERTAPAFPVRPE